MTEARRIELPPISSADWAAAMSSSPAAAADALPALHSMLVGLRRDHAAADVDRSSGRVEGNVNRIKTIDPAGS